LKLKIILVHNSYQQPGGEDVAFEQERKLLEDAGQTVVTYRRSNYEVEQFSGASRLALIQRTIWSNGTYKEFSRLLREEKPDLVHVHNTFMMISPSIYSACREAGVPVVQTLHNYRLLCPATNLFRDGKVCEECVDHTLLRGVFHGCYRESRAATATTALMLAVHRALGTWQDKVDAYIATTEFARQKFVAGGLPANRVHVKSNFLDNDPGPKSEVGNYALFVGRLSPEKGGDILLEAWERLSLPIPLQIIGDGPMREELETRVAQGGLSHVQFRGQLPRPEVIDAIKKSRFVIVPSQCYENFPVTIAEAFACGTAVICSRHGGLKEIVTDQCTGLHFTPGEPADLAAKTHWAWMHAAQMEEMGRAARLEYETRYTAEKNYTILAGIYAQVVSSRRRVDEAVHSFETSRKEIAAVDAPPVVSRASFLSKDSECSSSVRFLTDPEGKARTGG
jgi:glycosyltransferase involved in cell wall biosynthesis